MVPLLAAASAMVRRDEVLWDHLIIGDAMIRCDRIGASLRGTAGDDPFVDGGGAQSLRMVAYRRAEVFAISAE